MKKSTKVIVAIIAIAALVFGLYRFGYIDIPTGLQFDADGDSPLAPPTATCHIDLKLTNIEIFTIIQSLAGKSLNYTEVAPYITALNMKVYGCNDYDAYTLLEQFEAKYIADGWSPQGTSHRVGLNVVVFAEVWSRATQATMVATAEGALVTQEFGYASVYLSANGPITTFWQFWLIVS